MTKHLSRTTVIAGVLALGLVAGLSAQAGQAGQTIAFADLLAEVRGLRADLNQAAGASMRAQLLVARLSLQEQRIVTLGRQLTELQAQLDTAINHRSALETEAKNLDEAITAGSMPFDRLKDVEAQARENKTALAQARHTEQQLRGQESELSGVIAGEQSRWSDFNARLDEIERSLPAAKPR